MTVFKTGIGQDSHRILEEAEGRPLVLAGLTLEAGFALEGNSDSDVVLHAVTNALSGISGKPVLGPVADGLCRAGVKDSRAYLAIALGDVWDMGYRITHVSIALECQKPRLIRHFPAMRSKLEGLMKLPPGCVAFTATSGEGLTAFGQGLGVQAFAVVSAMDAKLFTLMA